MHRRKLSVSFVIIALVALAWVGNGFAQDHFKVLHPLTNTPGVYHPMGTLVMDAAGNLYGASTYGGSGICVYGGLGCGTVFQLTPQSDGSWTETVLYSFLGGSDGYFPLGGLAMDTAGNLYGTAQYGGPGNDGVIYKMTRSADGSWTQSVIHTFDGADGEWPFAGMIFDAAGNLYGTTTYGSAQQCGTVFKLSPNPDGSWTESVLHGFYPWEGCDLESGVVFDAAGNLYGTSWNGGTMDHGYSGTIFKLTPNSDGSWTMTVIYTFTGGVDGLNPAGVIVDASGNVYGTTTGANDFGMGVAYELKPNADGSYSQTVLYTFTGSRDGTSPNGLVFDSRGRLYGTTNGTAFR